MTLELVQQTGMSLIARPLVATHQSLVTAAGRNIVVLEQSGAQRILPGHSRPITAICTSPDGLYIASAQDGCICVWSCETGQARVIQTPGPANYLEFSPNSQFFAAVYDVGNIDVFECKGYQKIGAFNLQKPTAFVCWSQNQQNTQVLISSDDSRIYTHYVEFKRATLEYYLKTDQISIPPAVGLRRTFTCGACDHPYAYLGTPAGEICIFDLEQRCYRGVIKYFKAAANGVIATPNGLVLTSQAGDVVTLFGHDTNMQVVSEVAVQTQLSGACLCGGRLFTVSSAGSIMSFALQTVGIQPQARVQQRQTLPGQRDYLSTIPEGRDATAERGGMGSVGAIAVEAASLQINHTFPSSPIKHCTFCEQTLFCGTDSGWVQAWANGALVSQLQLCRTACTAVTMDKAQGIVYAAFQDQTVYQVGIGSDRTLKLLNKINMQAIVTSLDTNGKQLATACRDAKIFIIDARTMQIDAQITELTCAINSIRFDNVIDQLLHVATGQGYLLCYDISQNCVRIKSKQLNPSQQVLSFAQLQFGRYELICGCMDGNIRIYDFDVDDAVQIIKLPDGCIVNTKLLVAAQEDGKIVAGGCQLQGDELLLLMRADTNGVTAISSQLSHGLMISSLNLERDVVCITGLGGEIISMLWK